MTVNLNIFDDAVEKLDRSKTWINIKYKEIFSREIKPRKFSILTKQYENNIGNHYFVITLDNAPDKRRNYVKSRCDDWGRFKISIAGIWYDSIANTLTKDTNINIEHIYHDDDSDVYEIDI